MNLNPAGESPQKGTRSTKPPEQATESSREKDTCGANGFIAKQSRFNSIPLRLLCFFVANLIL
jgi:hypothetical protein